MINIDFTNITETSLDIKGFDVKVLRKDDKYAVVITNNTGYDFHDVPKGYKYIGGLDASINLIHQECSDSVIDWWCNGIYQEFMTGCIRNMKYKFTPSQINIILQAIENGVNEMEKICQPEVIKIREVTITKKYCDKQHVYLYVNNLRGIGDYPYEPLHTDNETAYSMGETYCLYDEIGDTVYIEGKGYIPNTDFKVTLSDADKIINIIRKSEEKIQQYEEELKKPKLVAMGCDFPTLDVHIKLTPEGDKYKISVDALDSMELYSREWIDCIVEELSGHVTKIPIKFHRGNLYKWYVGSNDYEIYESFNNNDEVYDKEKAEKMYVAIIAYFKVYEENACKINVGDKVKIYGSIGKILAIDEDVCWVKYESGIRITRSLDEVKKVME